MATLFSRIKVADFAAWKKVYDDFQATEAKSMGITAEGAFQLDGDPNDITVYHEFATIAAARAFAESPQLREAMQKAGVEAADIWFANHV